MDADRMWRQIGAMWEWTAHEEEIPGAFGGRIREVLRVHVAACPWCGAPFTREASTGGAYAGAWMLEPEYRSVPMSERIYGPGGEEQVSQTGLWTLTCPRCGWEGRFRAQEGA